MQKTLIFWSRMKTAWKQCCPPVSAAETLLQPASIMYIVLLWNIHITNTNTNTTADTKTNTNTNTSGNTAAPVCASEFLLQSRNDAMKHGTQCNKHICDFLNCSGIIYTTVYFVLWYNTHSCTFHWTSQESHPSQPSIAKASQGNTLLISRNLSLARLPVH